MDNPKSGNSDTFQQPIYDAQTGQPIIQSQTMNNQLPPVSYDPMTGQPIYQNQNIPVYQQNYIQAQVIKKSLLTIYIFFIFN